MSGTEGNSNIQSGTETQPNNNTANQSGADLNAEIQSLKEQISDLRKEAAKYRTTAKATATEKQSVEEQLKALQDEFAKTKKENLLVKRQSLLEKAGCIKSDLVVNVIPDDCEDVQAWIDNYKKENSILFKKEVTNHGGGYKPSTTSNLTPAEQMNSFIRTAAGR